jgi:hypothetical protein
MNEVQSVQELVDELKFRERDALGWVLQVGI